MAKELPSDSTPHLGKLPPAYKFLLNPFPSDRMRRCVGCKNTTHPRKFALLLHVDGWGILPMGKTCKYCSRCELIHCDQNELDSELVRGFSIFGPSFIGREYLVVGTVAMKTFNASMKGAPIDTETLLASAADFKAHIDFNYDPGGFRHEDADPAKYLKNASQASMARQTVWTTRHVDGSHGAER